MMQATRDAPGDDCSVDPRIERSRAAVVAAAADLLLEEGPEAITHGRVASAADVSRTTVYKHYPERSDLLRGTVEAIGKTAPEPNDFVGELRTDLRSFLGILATDLGDDRHARLMATMMERAQVDDTVAGVRDAMMSEFTSAFAELLQPAIDRGELSDDIDASRALASLGGALVFTRFLANRTIDDELVDALIEDFVRANAPR